MSRGTKFVHAVWSGYLSTITTSAINLLTIPFALGALGKTTFGLWSAVVQITALTNIFDLGLGPSLARFIADYKDHRESGAYADFLKSVLFIGVIQALVFSLAALALIPILPRLLNIPPENASQFRFLLLLQFGTVALGFPLRPFGQLLFANQRIAWLNSCNIASTLVNGGVLLGGLWAGWGVYSYIAASWAGFLISQTGILVYSTRAQLLPPLREATISLKRLKPLAAFSANVFVIALGLQLVNFAPTLLITRKLGVQPLADWTIGTRLILFAYQLIARIPNASEPVLWEMYVRKEFELFRGRLLELAVLAGSAAALVGGGIAAINPPFVSVWTAGRVQWLTGTDLCLVLWVVALTAATVFNMVPGTTKHLGSMKYVYLAEGLVPVTLAYTPLLVWHSQVQIALLLLLCVSGFRLPYGLWRTWKDLSISFGKLIGLLTRTSALALLLLFLALGLRQLTADWSPWSQVWVNGTAYAVMALPTVYFLGLPVELKHRLQQGLRRLLAGQSAVGPPSGPPHITRHNERL